MAKQKSKTAAQKVSADKALASHIPPAKAPVGKAGLAKAAPRKTPARKVAGVKTPALKVPAKRIARALKGERIERLWAAVQQVREGQRDSPRTTRLLAAGPPKLAQKLVEEAAEVAIEAVLGDREALVNESVDLIYNMVALWNGLGVEPKTVWAEMDRREEALGMAEKLPKAEDV